MFLGRHFRTAAIFLLACTSLAALLRAEDGDAKTHFLEQGWSDEERQDYYYIPQGSEIMPYGWFLALEQPRNSKPFRNADFLQRFGFLPNAKNKANPDGLPVGFTRSTGDKGPNWFGLTCAACHTSQMTYKNQTVQVDGGSNLLDMIGFQEALDDSIRNTLRQPTKFKRFATAVLGDDAKEEAKKRLRNELRRTSIRLGNWRATSRPAHPTGFGHWDAVTVLMNTITATALDEPANYRVPQIPVSFPSIWLTNDSDRLLWNASVSNVTLRQVGEVIIVFGRAKVSEVDGGLRFDTSARLLALEDVYDYTNRLEPPKWPEEVLGKLDPEKVARGAKLFVQEDCAKCHANKPPYPQSVFDSAGRIVPVTSENKANNLGRTFIRTHPTPISEVKTDPRYATYFVTRTAKPGRFAPAFKGGMFEGKKEVPAAILFLAALTAMTESEIQRAAPNNPMAQARLRGDRPLPSLPKNEKEFNELVESLLVYKAAPLPGIWASAPYLHNASVPNLYELLLPADQRSKKFTLGNREFDPKRVGYKTTQGGYRFDTSLPGYSNQGHEYGTDLSEADRWALVEYLKSL